MTAPRSGNARKRAEAAFKSKGGDKASSAATQLTAERFAREDKTARLRALRLAKEAADQAADPEAAGPRDRK
jgi:hypothetical protein